MKNEILETQQSIVVFKLLGKGNIDAGVRRMAALLDRDPATIHKWKYPRSRGGTGGYIPTRSLTDMRIACRLEGILIRPEHLYPEWNI